MPAAVTEPVQEIFVATPLESPELETGIIEQALEFSVETVSDTHN